MDGVAYDLAPALWNAIADLARRTGEGRRVYNVEVIKVDKTQGILFADEFGDVGIPLVAHTKGFRYYDTQPDGTQKRRGDDYEGNEAFQAKIIMPNVGDTVVIIDPQGDKSLPFCIGVIQSIGGYWEDATSEEGE